MNRSPIVFEIMFRQNPLPMWIYDRLTLQFLDANEAVSREFGFTREEFIALGAFGIRCPSEHARLRSLMDQLSREPAAGAFSDRGTWTYQTKDGRQILLEVRTADIDYSDRPARLLVGRNVTAQAEAEAALRASEERLRELAQRLQSIREEERAELSRTIHDELGQSLTALKIEMSVLAKGLQPPQRQRLEEAAAAVDRIIETIRNLATELRPSILDHLGLVAALDWQVREFNRRGGLRCEFEPPPREPDLSKDQMISLFRIAQEALTNVLRHARASSARVALGFAEGTMWMQVEDDGVGMDRAHYNPGRGSLGLLGMEERARSVGADLTFGPGGGGVGTRVMLTLPHPAPRAMSEPARAGTDGERDSDA